MLLTSPVPLLACHAFLCHECEVSWALLRCGAKITYRCLNFQHLFRGNVLHNRHIAIARHFV